MSEATDDAYSEGYEYGYEDGRESEKEATREEIRLLRRAIYLYERDIVPGYQNMRVRAGGNFVEPPEYKDWEEVRALVYPISVLVQEDKKKKGP